MLQVNILDIAVALLMAVFTVYGLFRGLVSEVAGLVGVILGFYLARRFQETVQPHVVYVFGNSEWTGLLTYVLVFMGVLAGVSVMAVALRKFMAVTVSPLFDHLMGGVAGFGKGLLLSTGVFYLLNRFLHDTPIVSQSQLKPFFLNMVDYLRNFLPANIGY